MSGDQEAVSFSEAAKKLGVVRQTVSDLVRAHNLPTMKMPLNAKARGLDKTAMRKLRRLLNRDAVSA